MSWMLTKQCHLMHGSVPTLLGFAVSIHTRIQQPENNPGKVILQRLSAHRDAHQAVSPLVQPFKEASHRIVQR